MSDVLSKIKAKRNRATVPAREDSLINKNQTQAESVVDAGSVDTEETSERADFWREGRLSHSTDESGRSPDAEKSLPSPQGNQSDRAFGQAAADSVGQFQALRAELEKYPEIVRHSAIRLEKDLDWRLTRFCKENGCTIETFLEAAFEEAEADTTWREKILRNALNRYASRKKAGKLRQLITQLEKAGV